MKNKNLFVLISILLTMLACSTLTAPAAPTEQPSASPTLTPVPPTALSQTLTISSSSFEEIVDTPPYTINAQIPFLQGSDDPRVQDFNSLLKLIAQSEIDSFRGNTLAYATNPPMTGGSFLGVEYALVGQRGEIWSIKYDISFYSDGAAHPGHYSITLTYDLANGREILLDELFAAGSNYLQVISDYCKSELATRDIAFDGFSSGAEPLPENYTRWNLSADGLIITFDEYQVAPYAAGPQVVTIPFSALQSVINLDGALALFTQ